MPPRTANSPRFSTSSTREYAAAASASTISPRSALCPVRRATGSRSPRPLTCGWSTERIGRDDDGDRAGLRVVGARVRQPAQHGEAAARRCRDAARAARAAASPRTGTPRPRPAAAASAAPRPGPRPRGRSPSPPARCGRASRASAATAKGRAAGGPTRSTCIRLPSAAAFTASVRAASLTTASSRPCRLMKGFHPGEWATRTARHVLRAGGLQRTSATALAVTVVATVPGAVAARGSAPETARCAARRPVSGAGNGASLSRRTRA